ncbi:flavin reductase family protein [Rhodopseudomonas palustris]|uniref:flavin reductase family protein n=1 Tax=Rhodopseudomonas palustris TaxID=1076 RepID=UPI002ACE1790|nr:flavin reductase family protein [Rhodopseudomonas palustris]WQH00323.1 flavin reductase family protein [Rhodopseudomonas palustris]
MSLDQRSFRSALSQFATGVAVITARGEANALIGMTMSSFNSVSLDPPLILFSVDRRALSLAAMQAADGYAVNILSRGQEALSNQFAKASSDKWSNVSHSIGHAEAPLLAGALAHFECAPYAQYDGGDHVIFVGRVVRFGVREDEEPLVFFRGKYQCLGRQGGSEPMWPLPIHY